MARRPEAWLTALLWISAAVLLPVAAAQLWILAIAAQYIATN